MIHIHVIAIKKSHEVWLLCDDVILHHPTLFMMCMCLFKLAMENSDLGFPHHVPFLFMLYKSVSPFGAGSFCQLRTGKQLINHTSCWESLHQIDFVMYFSFLIQWSLIYGSSNIIERVLLPSIIFVKISIWIVIYLNLTDFIRIKDVHHTAQE